MVIKAESLSKKYIIGHQQQERYLTLRDTMSQKFKEVGKRLLHPFLSSSGQPLMGFSNTEELWALKHVSFEIQQGDRVGIIGRNGAGKTTLLKILSRITEPTEGRVHIKGRVASLLEVGTGFHPELSGRENIYLNGAVLGMTKAEIKRKFDEIVAFAEVEKFLDTPVKRYSSGMYVRLAFAVAAHLEPEILVVDEVLAVGDAQFQKKCLRKMGEVGKEGRTVLFVSHNLTAIRTLCNRAILLRQGMLVADGSPNDTISKYMVKGVTESNLLREWDDEKTAPQNATAVLRRVMVCDDNGKQTDTIYTDTPFNIEIDYKVKIDGTSVGLNIIIYDIEDNCIMASINNHEPNWYGKPMPKGDYKSICKIPKNLFNNGYFSLSVVIFGKNFSDAFNSNKILNFEVIDGTEVRGDYYGAYASCIRPLFHWISIKKDSCTNSFG